jgi:glycerol kinase
VTTTAVLAVDQGTSGTKAVVVDPVDGVVAAAEVSLHPRYLPNGGVEQDPHELLDSVLYAGRQALEQAARPVSTVALANQGETVLAWDRGSGRPLSPAIVWQDRRAADVCAELQQHRDGVAARTGLVLDPYFSAPKMAWLRRNVTGDGVVTTSDSWLVHQLTGEFVTDPTTASRSLILDIDRVDWDDELLDLFGLGAEPLPRIAGCDEPVGETSAFGAPMTVGGLIVDQQAALLAQRCWEPGAAKCTFGTGAFLLANTGTRAVRSTAGLTSSVAWRTGNRPATYCIDGQVYTAASAVRWLNHLGFIGHASELDTVAGNSSEGVLCVPALAGLAAPWWRPDATASFTGITLATRPEHLVIAVLEGIAAQVAELTDVITADLGAPLRSLRVDGGLTRSRTLMQAVANLTQLPVELYPSAHATALGAAALARMAQHPVLGMADAVLDWAPADHYQPRWSADQADEFRSRWRATAAATLPPTPSSKDDR